MSRACASWGGEIGAYIVGALDQETGAGVRRHLRSCAACRAEYEDLVPVRDWLGRLAADGAAAAASRPGGPPVEPLPPLRRWLGCRWLGWRWLAGAAAAAAVAVIAGISAHPGLPVFHAADRTTGVRGQARLRATPAGTVIDLTVAGLPAQERCTLVAVSPAGRDIAGTWNADYAGTAEIAGTSAIPAGQLSVLRIESPSHRVLLSIPV